MLVGGWHEIWRPHRVRFLTEPRWMDLDPEQEASFQSIVQKLQSPAPSISGQITPQDFVRILNEICPTQLDDDNYFPRTIEYMALGDRFLSLETWLRMTLDRYDMQYTFKYGGLFLVAKVSRDDFVMRVYPCPVMETQQLLQAIEQVNPECWINAGGEASISISDTDCQSLVVIHADYATHRKLEAVLKQYYETAGIGWRSDVPGWMGLPRAFANRISWMLNPKSTQAATSTTPPNVSMRSCYGACMF